MSSNFLLLKIHNYFGKLRDGSTRTIGYEDTQKIKIDHIKKIATNYEIVIYQSLVTATPNITFNTTITYIKKTD